METKMDRIHCGLRPIVSFEKSKDNKTYNIPRSWVQNKWMTAQTANPRRLYRCHITHARYFTCKLTKPLD